MKFEKKLIILSGANNAKGTLTLEHNAYGTFASLNAFNLPDLNNGEYAVGIKNSEKVFIRKLGSLGRILARFSIDEMPLTDVHCIIYETAVETQVMYGTNSAKKLWEGNMMDGIKSKRPEFLETGKSVEPVAQLPEYSPREEKVENFFLDILPKDSEAYSDTAIASVNYYPSEMNIEVTYSKRDNDADFTNPIDKAAKKSLPWSKESDGDKTADKPSVQQTQKQQLSVKADSAREDKTKIKELISETANKADKDESKESPKAEAGIAGGNKSVQADSSEKNRGADEVASCVSAESATSAQRPAFINKIESNDEDVTDVPPLSSGGFVGIKNMELIFYEQVKGQIDTLFDTNPRFEVLEKMLPETKWTKVDYDHTGKYYVVGLVGSKPDYICYGVPAKYTPAAPTELSGYCQWLPLDETKPQGDGFWLMFQDAVTGESVQETAQ